METTQAVLRLLTHKETARAWLPASSEAIIVALSDDRVGDVLDRVVERGGVEVDTWVVMRKSKRSFHRMAVTPHDPDAVVETDDGPVSRNSEWGMLADYVELQGGRTLTVQTVPGFAFAEAAAV